MYPVTFSDKVFRNINKYLVKKSINQNATDNENRLILLGVILAFIRGILVYNIGFIAICINEHHCCPASLAGINHTASA